MKTGLSSADAVYAKVAATMTGSAMLPRMAEIDRKDEEGRKRGVCRDEKGEKRYLI